MDYVPIRLKKEFDISRLVSFHYFEFAKDFVFEGESHDFWEILYVDKGEVEIMAGHNGYLLRQGDLVFHQPNEFHSVWANKRIAPNIMVVSFISSSPFMDFFRGARFTAGEAERNILGHVLDEGMKAFSPPFDDPWETRLHRKNEELFGSEQMLQIHLLTLLIRLVRRNQQWEGADRISTSAKERTEGDLVLRMESYLADNLSLDISLSEICEHMRLGRTQLTALFKHRKGIGIMEYYRHMKIDRAKTMIREENHNFTEVADILGYSSIHVFSRHFRNATGMSPSEYARSVKSRTK